MSTDLENLEKLPRINMLATAHCQKHVLSAHVPQTFQGFYRPQQMQSRQQKCDEIIHNTGSNQAIRTKPQG